MGCCSEVRDFIEPGIRRKKAVAAVWGAQGSGFHGKEEGMIA